MASLDLGVQMAWEGQRGSDYGPELGGTATLWDPEDRGRVVESYALYVRPRKQPQEVWVSSRLPRGKSISIQIQLNRLLWLEYLGYLPYN